MFVFLECNEPVGLEDGRIPDSSFSVSSIYDGTNGNSKAPAGRLNHASLGWRAKNDREEPWLQIDLLFVRLVTGVATHGDNIKFLKTYYLSFGFHSDQLMTYLDRFNQRKVSSHFLCFSSSSISYMPNLIKFN